VARSTSANLNWDKSSLGVDEVPGDGTYEIEASNDEYGFIAGTGGFE
jgi:hypothetical protein